MDEMDGMDSMDGYLSLAEAAAALPQWRGKKVHTSCVWRWCTSGVSGVLLRHERIGSRILTRGEWLVQFSADVQEARSKRRAAKAFYRAPLDRPRLRTVGQRAADIARAQKALDAAGI